MQFLEEMIERGECTACLSAAESLLRAGGNSLSDLASINLAISRCRLRLDDYHAALAPALLARKIARDIQDYRLLGRACWVIASVYGYTHQYEQMTRACYEYFEMVPLGYSIPRDEAAIWENLGRGKLFGEAFVEAVRCFERALEKYRLAGDSSAAFRTLWWMSQALLSSGDHARCRTVLRECLTYSHRLPRSHWGCQAVLLARSELAVAEGHMERAAILAHRALSGESKQGKYKAYMLLHRVSLYYQEYKDAIGYALAARVTALEARRYDLEYEAAEAMLTVVGQTGADLMSELDAEYLSTGVDLTRYVPSNVLKERT